MKQKLIIVGTGFFAEVARDYFNEFTNFEVSAFSCHQRFIKAELFSGIPLVPLEKLCETHPPTSHAVFVAIGFRKMNKVRQTVFEEVQAIGYTCAKFVHPNVKIWSSTTLGNNVFIFEDNTIQPYTRIADNVILWSGNHIGHHSSIEKHCFISSHVVISGSCHIGNNTFIGVNATLHDSLSIAEECLIGAGAVISKDTKAKQVFVPRATSLFPKNSEETGF